MCCLLLYIVGMWGVFLLSVPALWTTFCECFLVKVLDGPYYMFFKLESFEEMWLICSVHVLQATLHCLCNIWRDMIDLFSSCSSGNLTLCVQYLKRHDWFVQFMSFRQIYMSVQYLKDDKYAILYSILCVSSCRSDFVQFRSYQWFLY